MEFRWNEWNLEHATQHGVTVEEIEYAVRTASRPWPERIAEDKFLVWGRTAAGRLVQMIYLPDDDETAYVIHARPLHEREKRRYRRRVQA